MQITVNQHYVPRFYMKHFANVINAGTRKEKDLISFYQFKDNLYKENIPTSSVCSEDYFYDKDGTIENSLANMEGKWSTSLKNVVNDNFENNDIENLREFIIYQIVRTKAMLSHNREMATGVMKGILKQKFENVADDENVNEYLNNKVQNEITAEYDLSFVHETIPTISDLSFKVITNVSKLRLLTSDAPIIQINPFGVHIGGLSSMGEVIFFPASPEKLVVFYDEKFFGKLPDKIAEENVIRILNQYQYVSADERLLANGEAEIIEILNNSEINSIREKFQKERKTNTIDVKGQTLFAIKSRSIPYYFNVPILCLPKLLRKIPNNYRETFSREYSYNERLYILCRIYRELDFSNDNELKEFWKNKQKYSRILLNFLDNYWGTPKVDRTITPELMKKIKTVPVDFFINK